VVKICGIIGCAINKHSNEIIKNLYDIFLNQKKRGVKGAGISINNGGSLIRFRSLSPFRLFNAYNYDSVWSKVGEGCRVLFHHRYPTSTENEIRFNHPFENEDKTIHLIHNGILMNDKELYKKLKHRHTFDTQNGNKDEFTDSEVMLHLFEDRYKGNADNIVKALEYVFDKTSGSFAVALQIKGDKNIYLIKHSSPLVISMDEDGNFYFSSELDKDNKNLKKVYELEEGEIGKLNAKGYKMLSKRESKDKFEGYENLNYWYYDEGQGKNKKWGK